MSRLHIRYGAIQRARKHVLQPGTIACPLPAAIGVVGINGSGKSSLFMHLTRTLARRTTPLTVMIGDTAVDRIAYVPQSPALPPWLTAERIAELYGHRLDHLVAAFPPLFLDELCARRAHTLSLGQRQVLCIALALAADVSLLIMDEPFAALDFRRRVGALRLLQDWKRLPDRALLISSQSTTDLFDLCDHFVVIRNGVVVFNAPREELLGADYHDDPERAAEERLLHLLS